MKQFKYLELQQSCYAWYRKHAHASTHTHTHAHAYAHASTYAHAYAHASAHAHAYAYAYAYAKPTKEEDQVVYTLTSIVKSIALYHN